MINKQRVRRIKNLIYAFIILILFLPLILMSILSLYMINVNQNMSDKLDELNKMIASQQSAPPAPSSSDSGYVIEPEGRAIKGESPSPRQMEEINPENTDDQAPAASGDKSEANGTSPAAADSSGTDAVKQGISDSNTGGAGDDASVVNPQTVSLEYPDGNPLTGR